MSVLYEVRPPAVWLTIDREDRRNALSAEVIRGLLDGLDRAAEDEAARVVIITGVGEKAFCAGGDITGFSEGAEEEDVRGLVGRLLAAIQAHPLPVVARVNGTALGGGLGLMLACDLAVAADDVEVGTPEINIGLWPHVVSAVIHRNVPRKVAMEMMLTGRRLPAPEGVRWGMINRAVPRARLDAQVEELAEELASKSPQILRLGKESFYGAQDLPFEEALEHLSAMLSRNLESEDLAEGVAAFLEKRAPRWRGR